MDFSDLGKEVDEFFYCPIMSKNRCLFCGIKPNPVRTNRAAYLSTLVAEDGPLEAVATLDQIRLRNTTEEKIYYFVVSLAESHRIDWLPQIKDEIALKPNQTLIIYREDLYFPDESTEVIVNWWQAVEHAEGGVKPGPVQNFTLSLPILVSY